MRMMADIRAGHLAVEQRGTDDVERLLRSPAYRAGRLAVKAADPPDTAWRWSRLQAVRAWHIPRKLAQAAGLRKARQRSKRDVGAKTSKGDRT
jgi:hypothetical protein